MDWILQLVTDADSIGHIMLVYAVVISIGMALGRIKVLGVSLGVTFVLFAALALRQVRETGQRRRTPPCLRAVPGRLPVRLHAGEWPDAAACTSRRVNPCCRHLLDF